MYNLGGLVLHKILQDPTSQSSLEAWAKLKLNFFAAEYMPIFSALHNFYNKYGTLPSFNDLTISLREGLLLNNLKALEKIEVPEDVDIMLIVNALLDEYTQEETLKQLDVFIDNVTLLDTEEIKQELSNIVMFLDEKTHTSESVCLMSDITIAEDVDIARMKVPLGINNTFDADVMAKTSELIMIGGKRGSGKSIVANNMTVNQYLQGNSSLFFSIEMDKREVFDRTMSMLSGVDYQNIRKGTLDQNDYDKLAIARRDMFIDGQELYKEYLNDRDFNKFENALIKKQLKPDNQIVIIDNRRLTLADIDLNIQKYKTQFKDKLKLVVVDYVNQIEIEDIYSWQQQIVLSKQLKQFARKYDIVMVSPYQIDGEGEARFSKGLLDAPDIAAILKNNKDHLKFESSKIRNGAPFDFSSPMDWKCLRMDPTDYVDVGEVEEEDYTPKVQKDEDLPF